MKRFKQILIGVLFGTGVLLSSNLYSSGNHSVSPSPQQNDEKKKSESKDDKKKEKKKSGGKTRTYKPPKEDK